MTDGHQMTFKEMAQLVDGARELAYRRYEMEQEEWWLETRNKAKAVVSQLEKHLPPQLWQEMLELSETIYGGKCIAHDLRERSGCTDSWKDDHPYF
jgi:hypothetical protein